MDVRGVRLSSGLVSIVAAATSTVLWILSAGKKAVVKKLIVHNHQGAAVTLQIGHLTLGGAFTPDVVDFYCLAGIDNVWTEFELPIFGNTREGFCADTTPVTGTLGNIIAQASAAGADPADVEVCIEVEES